MDYVLITSILADVAVVILLIIAVILGIKLLNSFKMQ